MKENATNTTTQFPPPPPELIDDIRQRLAELPADLRVRVDDDLKREPLQHVARLLWKAGHGFATSDLYEYRRTLFPPDAMVDPYTAGAPGLRTGLVDSGDGLMGETNANPPQTSPANLEPKTVNAEPLPASHQSDNPPIHSEPRTPNHEPSAASLLSDLRDVITRYVVLPEMAAEALALWVVHTYAFTLREVSTYIGVVSPEKRCGKTTLLELLGRLAHEAIAAANISPSALFRVIEQKQPTLIIDEADTFLHGRDEMAGILNAGYRKGNAYVIRVADGKAARKERLPKIPHPSADNLSIANPEPRTPNPEPRTPNPEPTSGLVRFSCWCPKVMATIGRLPDTLADRCIIITMQRKLPGEQCERLRDLDAMEYRRRCADFVEQHRSVMATARPNIPSALNDRAADIWEPLLAIADLAGGDWPQLARDAARQLSASDDEITLLGYFLGDIRALMLNSKVDRVLSRDIIRVLNPMHDRPWEDLRRGREINEWWLGWQMRELGIRPRMMRAGDAQGRGYLLEEIEAAYRRYVPNVETPTAPAPVAAIGDTKDDKT